MVTIKYFLTVQSESNYPEIPDSSNSMENEQVKGVEIDVCQYYKAMLSMYKIICENLRNLWT